MLPAAHRLTSPEQFRTTVRRGRRRGSATLVAHLLVDPGSATVEPESPVRAGFVVSKAVGGAVVRNRVKRRLRHLVRPHLQTLPPGATLVVRALPPAAAADSSELGRDLALSLSTLVRALVPSPTGAEA